MSYNSLGNPRVDLRISSAGLSGNWANGQVFSTMLTNWANCSDYRVSVYSTNTDANITLETPTYWRYSVDILALTIIYDKSGNSYGDTTDTGIFGNRINMATVRFNSAYDYSSVTNLTKTMTHEIGHCFNLGHLASTSTSSIMRTGWNLPWTNYDQPQSYDRTTISNLYNMIYS